MLSHSPTSFIGIMADTLLRTFSNVVLEVVGLFNKITGRGQRKIQILRDFEGLIKSGELLVVLGKPGSGCSTLLKTIAGETDGFFIDSESNINYQGISVVPSRLQGSTLIHSTNFYRHSVSIALIYLIVVLLY